LALVNKYSPHGFSDWAWQRATALMMLVYIVLVFFRLMFGAPINSATSWVFWFKPFFFRLATLFFCYALIYHAWLGVKEMLIDYVRHDPLRSRLKTLFCAMLLGDAVWASFILWSLD